MYITTKAEGDDQTFAEKLFHAQAAFWNLESELWDHVDRVLELDIGERDGKQMIGDVTFDHHDNSIELRSCAEEFQPTDEQLLNLLALGFQRGWVHWAKSGEEVAFRLDASGLLLRGSRYPSRIGKTGESTLKQALDKQRAKEGRS